MQNIIFLSIDALSYTRLGNSTESESLTPFLDDLSKKGISCANAFSNGQPTQMAFPSIFTSTLPLDCGGYNRGIKNREITLTEVMKRNGFYTAGFATVNFLGRFYYYDRGFDEFHEIYNIKRFWKSLSKNFFSYYVQLMKEGLINFEEFCEVTGKAVKASYKYLVLFCEEKNREIKENTFGYNPIIHAYDYSRLRKLILRELDLYENNPQEYLSKQFDMQLKYDRIINIARYGESPFGVMEAYINATIEDIMVRLQNKLGFGYSYILKKYDHFVSAKYLRECIIDWIDKRGESPFFLWAHFLDIHEGNYTSGKIQLPPISGSFLKKRVTLKRDEIKGHYNEYATRRAIKYVDDQLGKVIRFLKEKDLLDKTLLVITSDHGMEDNSIKRSGHKATLFYDEFIRVPMIFYNARLKPEKITNMCSQLDLAPTILDLMGIGPVTQFKGVPVYSSTAKDREFIISENNGRGPCDLKRKKINIAIRTERYKYIWSEGNNPGASELYDLESDPGELDNLSGNKKFKETLRGMDELAQKRCRQIRKNTKETIRE
ncbi:MAG: sulfatase-like hydrolase/transferase [Thermodesulfobacteriota bacterium]|nr:sulfatase-like hydrolase/transferase [Thermodesulfobacteriota bacterium]